MIEDAERRLDSFDPSERKEALNLLCEKVRSGEISVPEPGSDVNMHCHTFFSYNSYGYSPSKFAWLARKSGMAAAGIVDFDVLDGLDEFYEAGRMLGLKVSVGMETRVYIPEFSDREINSPGEPGISYHMGVGFPSADLANDTSKFQHRLVETARNRNCRLIKMVNAHLRPLELDYGKDVLSLTPAGNATERHICTAYVRKAREIFPDDKNLAEFWVGKLGIDAGELDFPDGLVLQETIRAKTMKRGGIGYVKPDKGSFPEMADMNRFVLASGSIPTHTWLDGTSAGEQAIEELLDVAVSAGAAAINIIPDRNYTANLGRDKGKKLSNLYDVVKLAEKLNLIVVVGTEMNRPGQKFVDDFGIDEMASLAPVFLKGAHIVYAHSVLQRGSGLGYTSDWAKKNFPDAGEKNEFFEELGSTIRVDDENMLEGLNEGVTPEKILEKVR